MFTSGAPGSGSGAPTRRAVVLLLVAALAIQGTLFLGLFREHHGALIDDAFISFSYAARWAEGRGLTWNDGQAVEGFSNPLWTLGLGLGAGAGIPPHRSAPWLGLLCLLALGPVLLPIRRARGYPPAATVVLVGLTATDVGLAQWAGSGLETASAALLVAAWLAAAAGIRARGEAPAGWGRGVVLGLLGAGLALSRPEGWAWAWWGFGWLLWGAWVRWRVLGGWLAGMLPAWGYLAYRWHAYRSLVPNTFQAKMEAGERAWAHGLDAVGAWGAVQAAGILLLLAGLALARRRRGKGGRDPGPSRCSLWGGWSSRRAS